jgi:uncharacterized metal-binding protein YceD (DUF177 family)
MGELKIPLHDLDTHGKDFVFALDASWLNGQLEGTGVSGDASTPGEVTVHAQRNGTEILVHGSARARLIAQCGRCLNGTPVNVSCDLAALYAPRAAGAVDHADDTDEDLDVDPDEPDREFYTGDQVEIDDLVRDYLLLELPMQPRCDPPCDLDIPEDGSRAGWRASTHMRAPEGVSSTKSSGERGLDPRLAPLQKLAQKGESDKE